MMKRQIAQRPKASWRADYCYDRRLVFFGVDRAITVYVKHNNQTYVSFNVCRNYIFGLDKSLKRFGLQHLDPIYSKITKYRSKARNNQLTPMDHKKLWGLAKQAKMLNPMGWVFYQDPSNGLVYEVFPDKRSYNSWYTANGVIF